MEEVRTAVALMRELGITYLKTASLELQLGPQATTLAPPTEISLALDAKRRKEHQSKILFGAVGMRPMLKEPTDGK